MISLCYVVDVVNYAPCVNVERRSVLCVASVNILQHLISYVNLSKYNLYLQSVDVSATAVASLGTSSVWC